MTGRVSTALSALPSAVRSSPEKHLVSGCYNSTMWTQPHIQPVLCAAASVRPWVCRHSTRWPRARRQAEPSIGTVAHGTHTMVHAKSQSSSHNLPWEGTIVQARGGRPSVADRCGPAQQHAHLRAQCDRAAMPTTTMPLQCLLQLHIESTSMIHH